VGRHTMVCTSSLFCLSPLLLELPVYLFALQFQALVLTRLARTHIIPHSFQRFRGVKWLSEQLCVQSQGIFQRKVGSLVMKLTDVVNGLGWPRRELPGVLHHLRHQVLRVTGARDQPDAFRFVGVTRRPVLTRRQARYSSSGLSPNFSN